MSQILEQQVLTASQILRKTNRSQCFYRFADDEKRCAIGVLLQYFGGGLHPDTVKKVDDLLGLDMWRKVQEMNDTGFSFTEIADWLEEQGL